MEQLAPKTFRRDPVAERKDMMRSFTRAVIARAAAALDNVRASDYAASTWPDDPGVGLVLRAAVSPTLMANATALTPISVAILEQIKPLTAAGELFSRGMTVSNFGGGTVRIPGFAASPADFVAENAPIPVEQFTAPGPTLAPYKLASIVTASSELIEHSDADTIIRAVLAENIAVGLDAALFSAAAATAARPAGLTNGIAALTASTGGAGQDNMAGDLNKLLTAIAAVAGGGYLLVAAVPQAISLQFRLGQRVPNVLASGALATGTVIAIAPQAFVGVLETPRIESSIEAIVHQEDTTPLEISASGVMSAPVRSLFQTNSVGLRIIAPVSWAMRTTGAVAWISGTNW